MLASTLLPMAAGAIFLSSRILNPPPATGDVDWETHRANLQKAMAARKTQHTPLFRLFFYSADDLDRQLPIYDHFLTRKFVALGLYGAIYGCLRSYASQISANTIPAATALFILAGGFLAFYVRRESTDSLTLIWKLIAPLSLIGLALVPLANQGITSMGLAIIQTALMLFECVIWIVLFDTIAQPDLNKMAVFGVGRGITVLFMALGAPLTKLCNALPLPFSEAGNTILAVVFTAIVIVSIPIFLFNEKEVAATSLLEVDDAVQERIEQAEKTMPRTLEQTCQIIGAQKQLTPRETDVLILLAQGKSGPAISEELFLSTSTVKSHTYNLYKKLDIHTRTELLAYIQSAHLN